MNKYKFHTGKELLRLTRKYKLNISDIVLLYEVEMTDKKEERIRERMLKRYRVMKRAAKKGARVNKKSISRMSGGNAYKIFKTLNSENNLLSSQFAIKVMGYAIGNCETNACMGQIVACPTAGASGVLPGILVALEEEMEIEEEVLTDALFNAAGIGLIIAENATLSGAEGGCQAEIGSAAAMAASAITEIRGGNQEQCLNAAALALKNFLGLACDPVGGMVEIPCIKRNAFAAIHAITASDLSLCGVKSYIEFDEVVEAMKNIGKLISPRLRETAMGGLAATKTGEAIKKKIGFVDNGINE